jgi:hypothetical protein
MVRKRTHYPLRSADLGSLLHTVWTDGLALDIVLKHSVDKAQDGSLTIVPEAYRAAAGSGFFVLCTTYIQSNSLCNFSSVLHVVVLL